MWLQTRRLWLRTHRRLRTRHQLRTRRRLHRPLRRPPVWLMLLLVGMAAGVSAMLARPAEIARAMPACPQERPILIDPGHGGIDGGANIPGMLEKEIVLDVALRTARYLQHYRVPTLMTRSSDEDLGGRYDGARLRRDLNYRIRLANHCRALLMLSLHVNSASNPQERGIMIFYQSSRLSRDAAYFFDDVLRRWPLHERAEQPHARDFAVLRWPHSPAVLIELGFLTNADDRLRLADSAYREELARALASAITAIYHQWMKQGEL